MDKYKKICVICTKGTTESTIYVNLVDRAIFDIEGSEVHPSCLKIHVNNMNLQKNTQM